MNTNDDLIKRFNFPLKGEAEAFWEAQKLLGEVDSRFNEYFNKLIYQVKFSDQETITNKNNILKNAFIKLLIIILKLTLNLKFLKLNKKTEYDILINPSFCTFERETEQDFILNLINACISQNLTLCIICNDNIQQVLAQKIPQDSINKNIVLIDPVTKLGWLSRKIIRILSELIARSEFNHITELLAKKRIVFDSKNHKLILSKVFQRLSWLQLQNKINFKLAVLRYEVDAFSYPIIEYAKSKAIPIVSFQHGVVSHTLDIPVKVNRFFTFGQKSKSLLKEMNQKFMEITHQSNLCSDFIPIGAINDTINLQSNNFANRSILILDQSVERAIKFNGLTRHFQELKQLIEITLEFDCLKKVVIRPHPETYFSDFWQSCVNKYPDKLELSHPKFTLQDDISRNSIAVGLFSGALTIAAASGLPSYFLHVQDGYFTPDLDCFKDRFVLPFDQLYQIIKKLMTDEEFYLIERQKCLEKSSSYYFNNQQVKIDQNFIKDFILDLLN